MDKQERLKRIFRDVKICRNCGGEMKYAYGEMYECQECGFKELSDFGKIKEYLSKNGPTPSVIVHEDTGVPLDVINDYLREGRIEIPDGSYVYIKCENCGTNIRYGRYCPDCIMKLSNNSSNAVWNKEMGEKPKIVKGNPSEENKKLLEKMNMLSLRKKKNIHNPEEE